MSDFVFHRVSPQLGCRFLNVLRMTDPQVGVGDLVWLRTPYNRFLCRVVFVWCTELHRVPGSVLMFMYGFPSRGGVLDYLRGFYPRLSELSRVFLVGLERPQSQVDMQVECEIGKGEGING